MEILKYIAARDRFAHKFLVMYITKVLKDSEIYDYFNKYSKHLSKNGDNSIITFNLDKNIK